MRSPDNSILLKLKLLVAHHDLLRSKVPFISRRYIRSFRQSQMAAARRLREKEVIDVAFMLTTPGMWKADYLFSAMRDSGKFHPYIVIYPYSQYKGFAETEIEDMIRRTEAFAQSKGLEYVIPCKNGNWLDIKETLRPDIVFFSTPYKDHLPKYFIHHFKDTLTCYIPYGFTNFAYLYQTNYNLLFHNLVGCYFLETELHRQLFTEHSRCHGASGIVTGYPGTEVFLHHDYSPADTWKQQPAKKKRVVWAPHHSIEEGFALSSFLLICEDMLRLADKYSDTIQFVFKPHQLLRLKLNNLWGMERTAQYYNRWAEGENTQIEESSYVDLFLTSDALIHDSGSFTTEYLFTHKPVLFTVRSDQVRSRYSPFGQIMFDAHYHASCVEEIDSFLKNVVIDGNDPMQGQRNSVYGKYLAPIDGMTPSKKIIDEITKLINS